MSLSIRNEDHTLLNPLRHVITNFDRGVEFCCYSIPHPSENIAILTVQMKNEAEQSLDNTIKSLIGGCDIIEAMGNKLIKEIEK